MVEIGIPMSPCLCQRRAESNLLSQTGDTVITALRFPDIGPLRRGSGTPGDPSKKLT